MLAPYFIYRKARISLMLTFNPYKLLLAPAAPLEQNPSNRKINPYINGSGDYGRRENRCSEKLERFGLANAPKCRGTANSLEFLEIALKFQGWGPEKGVPSQAGE